MIQAREIHKSYVIGNEPLRVLSGATLDVQRGEFVAIMGASGSGKSTLLHILGALDVPDSGTVEFEGTDVFSQSARHREFLRCERIGFVFQFYHLLPELDVFENILLPKLVKHSVLSWISQRKKSRQSAEAALDAVGLSARWKHRPNQLSGGERQRVAIARALVNEPTVLLADEPTGNLDTKTGKGVLDLLCGLHERGQTIVMVTHDAQTAARADRCVLLEEGRIKAC